jgi:alpha-tubulin suppressor-like RCC1 family protein
MVDGVQVSCFADHSLALSSKEGADLEGSVWSWGYGAAGRLGLDDATSKVFLSYNHCHLLST